MMAVSEVPVKFGEDSGRSRGARVCQPHLLHKKQLGAHPIQEIFQLKQKPPFSLLT